MLVGVTAMALPRNRPAPASTGVREYLLRSLRGIEDRLKTLGRLRDPHMRDVYSRCYGLDRIEALERGEAVGVVGYQIAEALSPEDRAQLDGDAVYVLHPDGSLSPL